MPSNAYNLKPNAVFKSRTRRNGSDIRPSKKPAFCDRIRNCDISKNLLIPNEQEMKDEANVIKAKSSLNDCVKKPVAEDCCVSSPPTENMIANEM